MWSALMPGSLLAWRERRRALRELGDLEQQDQWKLASNEANLVNRAKVSLELGDRTAALEYWNEAKTRYPRFTRMSRDSLEVLLGLKLFDEAEAWAVDGQRREPRDSFYAGGHALVAERRGDTEEAIRRWEHVRQRFPTYWMGYVNGGMCLRAVGQLQAADELHGQATTLFPTELRTWLEWAKTAEYRQDWPEAIRRWETTFDRFRHSAADVGIAWGLENLGRLDEAEERLKAAQRRSPLAPQITIAIARVAEKRGDKEAAVVAWADTVRRFPMMPTGYQGGFRILSAMGRDDDAEAILLSAIKRFPAEAWPAVEHAALAHGKRDWQTAADRWATIRAGWPDRPDGYLRGAEALAALGRRDEAAQLRDEYRRRRKR